MGNCLEKLFSSEHATEKRRRPEIQVLRNENETEQNEGIPLTTLKTETRTLVALYDYSSRDTGDISFQKSDQLVLVSTEDNDWWFVRHSTTNEEGFVPSNFIAFTGSLQSEEWFFGTITRKDAERLLLKDGKKGYFLIRESETSENSYSLSLLNEDAEKRMYVKHYLIHTSENDTFFVTEGTEFEDLSSLVKYYHGASHGLCCQLVKCCPLKETPQTFSLGKNVREIEESRIQIQEELDGGFNEKVYKALWNGKMVVTIKTYNDNKTPEHLDVLTSLHHKNILKFYGTVSSTPVGFAWEYTSLGNLLKYLKRGDGVDSTLVDLIDIAAQVAAGMTYLEYSNFSHKFLRAQSVMVKEGPVFKVADYGMYDYPLDSELDAFLWLSPEAIENDVRDIKADVWTFGILTIEILTKGTQSYYTTGIPHDEILEKLKSGYRMPRPDECPEALYELLMQCWDKESELRPTFEYIQIFLESFFQRSDVDASKTP